MGRAVIYMLDTNTNTCIYIINQRPPQVRAHFERLRYGAVVVSSITGAELAVGVAKSGSRRNQDALEEFLAPLEVLPFDSEAMYAYGALRRTATQAPLDFADAPQVRHLSLDSGDFTGRVVRRINNLPRI